MSENTRQDLPQTPQTEPSGFIPAVVRIFWLMFGNAFLVVLAGLIIQKGTFSFLDIFFWVLVGSLIAIRYYDITRLHGLTAECEPANLKHWSRYSFILLLISAAVWTFAHVIRLVTG